MSVVGHTSEAEPMAYFGDLYYDPYPYRIGDFPTYCYVCGMSYWGSYHECRGWRPPPPPLPTITTNNTVDNTWVLAAAINRLAAAIEQLVARYDGDERKEEDEQ